MMVGGGDGVLLGGAMCIGHYGAEIKKLRVLSRIVLLQNSMAYAQSVWQVNWVLGPDGVLYPALRQD
jgi:hypothetical protein